MLHYEDLELEVVRFAAEDVITTSGDEEAPAQPGDCGDSPPCPSEDIQQEGR